MSSYSRLWLTQKRQDGTEEYCTIHGRARITNLGIGIVRLAAGFWPDQGAAVVYVRDPHSGKLIEV